MTLSVSHRDITKTGFLCDATDTEDLACTLLMPLIFHSEMIDGKTTEEGWEWDATLSWSVLGWGFRGRQSCLLSKWGYPCHRSRFNYWFLHFHLKNKMFQDSSVAKSDSQSVASISLTRVQKVG